MLARTPLNLHEYAAVDVYWYRELGSALAAYRDGQSQRRDVRQRIADNTESKRRGH